jgi:hypothetical protein
MNSERVSDKQRTRLIAGVSVADNPLIAAVIEYAQRISEPYLFNHVASNAAPASISMKGR